MCTYNVQVHVVSKVTVSRHNMQACHKDKRMRILAYLTQQAELRTRRFLIRFREVRWHLPEPQVVGRPAHFVDKDDTIPSGNEVGDVHAE